jgi:hypothetical protein
MRLVVMLDCLQPVRLARFLVTALAWRLALQAGPSVVLVPDAQPRPTWSGSASLNPRRARTACTWTFASHPGTRTRAAGGLGGELLTPELIDEDGLHRIVMADPAANVAAGSAIGRPCGAARAAAVRAWVP